MAGTPVSSDLRSAEDRHIIGGDTRQLAVRTDAADPRTWQA